MTKYDVLIVDSTYENLEKILLHKVESSQTNTGAINFRNEIFKTIKELNIFPLSGKKMGEYHVKVVRGHLLIYSVDTKNKKVYVHYVKDPKQNSTMIKL